MRGIVNSTIKLYLKTRYKKLEYSFLHPHVSQSDILENLLFSASETEVGTQYQFDEIRHYQDFKDRLPVNTYEDVKHDINRMMHGLPDVLWPGVVYWYAKSSGTTHDKSKFIPVSRQNLKHCHVKGFWDSLAILYNNYPDAKIFEYNNLVLGGTLYDFEPNPETRFGDISAILIHEMPLVGRPFYSPDFETAFIKKWDEKIERAAQLASRDRDIGSIGGVPTWNIVLFKRILEITGKSNLLEVWPNLQVYLHGGVNFKPYRSQFEALIPRSDFIYQETYNASEGYFACQNDYTTPDLLLFLDNGVFYEFIPLEKLDEDHSTAVPLEGVETGINYAIVITTNTGLWRYMPGDTVMFTSTDPYKIVITGRTKHFINAFGEEVMVANTDEAISQTCQSLNVRIREYMVAPVYLNTNKKGSHQWLIEFDGPAPDLEDFADLLDENLQSINSDYEAKRFQDMALERLQITTVPGQTFENWLRNRGKMGAQVKVPRLSNDRKNMEEILAMIGKEAAL
ncbi:MAG: GH3 auxin-responsive promoter family protein [Saprospiraceae bacterium]|nr:GH3 auxin-responsive promoter family protein [Saprospiraceae bacterium]